MQLLNKRLCVLYSVILPSIFSQLFFFFFFGDTLVPFVSEMIFISPNETAYKIIFFKFCSR